MKWLIRSTIFIPGIGAILYFWALQNNCDMDQADKIMAIGHGIFLGALVYSEFIYDLVAGYFA